MLAMINDFRTGSDTWYWNSDNTTKTQLTDLTPLVYDYNLEKIAMQRAAEIVASFEHTRPNGESCWSLKEGTTGSSAENIAIGQRTAASVFTAWLEADEPYSGQGHRRNMLGSYGAVGIGHFYYNNRHYWVQEFGFFSGAPETPANDSPTTVDVSIRSDWILERAYTPSMKSYQLNTGESAALPTVTLELRVEDCWPNIMMPTSTAQTPVWEIRDPSVAAISGTNIVAVAPGTTTLVGTVSGNTVEIPITVTQKTENLSKAVITLSASTFTYDGKAKTPDVTVTLNGTKLTKGTDYKVTYSNNTNVGTAKVTVTGTGKYTGTASTTFTIKKDALDLSKAVITLSVSTFTYDGKAKTPDVTVTLNGTKLTKGTDYKVTYSNNTNVGTAKVTVTGTGKYTGTASTTFTIQEKKAETKDLSGALVSLSPTSFTYDGKAKTPDVTVTLNGAILTRGNDYTVTYYNNINAGTAIVSVTGIGKCTGTVSAAFTIKKAANRITIKKTTYRLKYSAKKAQTITLKPKADAGKITYSSNKAKVKVNKNGKVTIAKKFSGKATITIKVTDKNYKTVTKKIVIQVKKK